ncbi:hypothetical protein E3U43_015215 [Larimichthys crocea]|uniref:Uncharacterized protein n=1 Tax=Larimichthys crocea TaxID=215358 RepID=A0ACD3RPG0_LARCR|nr:hypothetical protein E3U43_015215 [Larimichthys crocea]
MASTKKQKGMVFHQERETTPAGAPAGDHPPVLLVVPKPGKASEDGMEQSMCVTNEEAGISGKPNMYPSKEAIRTSGGHPASSNPQSDNLSSDSICKGIRVTLDNNSMWNEFFRCRTEMILTKQGSRMFPYCRFRISGLQPSRKYSLIMDIQPLDNSRYRWTGKSWQVSGKPECHVKSQPFAHPESPSTGQHWMQNPVSFYKLKLTNNIADQEGNTILHPMHRYLPRLHVIQSDKATKDIKLNGPCVVTFTFPQTEFMAVTAYQNSRFAQLKVEYNPFAKGLKEDSSSSWGLKLKLNSGKDSLKGGGTTTSEKHPLKKSLKSLLANHKPRSFKAVDSKPSVSDDLQMKSTTNKDQSTTKVTEDGPCNSHPAQKLFSELIREAHVSLQRCNLEQLGINNSTSHRTERTNTKTTAPMSNGQDVSKRESVRTRRGSSPAKKGDAAVTRRKVKEGKDCLNYFNCSNNLRADCFEVCNDAASQGSSVDSNGCQCKPEEQSEVNVKQHKRPAPLPLPALALFLKQHSTKSKKARSKSDSPPLGIPPENLSESQTECQPLDHIGEPTGPSKDITNSGTGAHLSPDEIVFNVTGQDVETSYQLSGPSCPDDTTDPNGPRTDGVLDFVSVAENDGTEPAVPAGTPVLPKPDQPFCTSTATISATDTTSSLSPISSPLLDTVLPAPISPQASTIAESSTLPPDSMNESDSLLPDPECSSFGFEPLLPASSPEPLPPMPALLTLQLDSTTTEPSLKVVPPEEFPHPEGSGASVFKWHTVLPPLEPYIDTSFTPFQPAPQTLTLPSVTSPLLPSPTASHHEPQTFDTSTPHPGPVPSFQENEQSLPFPTELSPLALQLPLSPTFSSLDGDGLSPTPSITDLVHFFSTDDDLGMEVDFSNTEAVAAPCPPPTTAETNTPEVSQQVQPAPANKPCKHKKKSQPRKLAKKDPDQKTDDATYTSMQPNLEEVEEQLFISFTSKEALKLHVVDAPEETDSPPQTTHDVHLRQISDTPENDKSSDVGGISLLDSINPNNFPAKLWRLVNNPANKAIRWDGHGEVVVIDHHLFERQFLSPITDNADAFKTTNFSSFVRQLNLYGFRRADPTAKNKHHPTGDIGTFHYFSNPNFKRDHPELIVNLKRLTVNNKVKLQAGLDVKSRPPRRRVSGGDDVRDGNMKKVETAKSLEEKIIAFEKILLRDLKLMRHRQVIHPVLQEVGLKMNLLDSTLAIDLQYLGVRLPIPPAGVQVKPQTQDMPTPQGVCAAFVSRTGKTTDVTQIKGWREKFTPSEAPPAPAPPKPEAGSGCDPQKKNLSAFCSDMLDEYLENEGRLIDERAASFSQPVEEPLVYELPTRSSSYVRTLDSVLKKQTGSPTSDLISGFIPPSKRHKLSLKESRTSRRENAKQRGPKHKLRPEPAAALLCTPVLGPAGSDLVHEQHGVQNPDSLSSQQPTFKRRKRLKPKTSSQTLSPHRSTMTVISEDMAPLESDSELRTAAANEASKRDGGPVMTRTLLRQKDLEDGVVWEGRPRTNITEERAAIALTSLFTLQGFVRENPTAPIQLIRRRPPPCLNDFCRLGCVCSSLAHCARISHCGRPQCMLGCSCLKQKVVLLKNLDGSDSSPSHHVNNKKRRRKRRMKMAYILKEAESVSQPAERVRTLWKRDIENSDPEPTHVPKPASRSRPTERADNRNSCARVRAYRKKAHKEDLIAVKSKTRLKPSRKRVPTLRTGSSPPAGDPGEPASLDQTQSPPAEPLPKPSKRLIILAECKWVSDADRNQVLKKLCERMALDRLDRPFWIKKYLISPISQTVEESGADRCIQYKIHISRPRLEREEPAGPVRPPPPRHGRRKAMKQQQQVHLNQVAREAEPLEDWQRQVEEEGAGPLEDWQRQVEEEGAGPLEDWQREVEEEDIEEDMDSTAHHVHDGRERRKEEVRSKKKKMVTMALPFLTGISPAGFLSANRKQPGGTEHLVQVNRKFYPLAKIQLGKMGALHPANRLAAYLTGRVGSNRNQQGSTSCASGPRQNQSTGSTVQAASPVISAVSGLAADPPPRSQPAVAVLTIPAPPTVLQPAPVKVERAASSDQPSGKAPEGAGSKVVTVKVFVRPTGGASQVRVVPGAPVNSDHMPGNVNPPPKGSQLLMVQVPGLQGKAPAPAVTPTTPGQRMVLQPVQAVPGVQYYRRPDGKLVQLVPISQLKPFNPNQLAPRGPSPSVHPVASPETPVLNQTFPVTTSPSRPSLSGLQSFTVNPAPSQLGPAHSFLSNKETCTFKILPTNSSREPILVTCAKVPPTPCTNVAPGSFTLLHPFAAAAASPVNLISLKPSAGQGAELGVKTVTASAVPVGPGEVLVPQKPASPQTTATRPPPPPPGSKVTPVPTPCPPVDRISAAPEPACDPGDLDVICVEDETWRVTTETVAVAEQSADAVDISSGSDGEQADNTSTIGDETDGDKDRETTSEMQRHIHNVLEKKRRVRLHRLFEGLRTTVGLSDITSKHSMLKKAVQVIQVLTKVEAGLEEQKRRLMARRSRLLKAMARCDASGQVSSPEAVSQRRLEEMIPSDEEKLVTMATHNEVPSVAVETVVEKSQLIVAQRKPASVDFLSDHHERQSGSSVKKMDDAQSITAAIETLCSALDSRNCPKRRQLKQVQQDIWTEQNNEERLKSLKTCLSQQRDAYVREICQRSGKSEQSVLSELRHLSSNQTTADQSANQLPAEAAASRAVDDIIITSSDLRQAPPTLTPVHQAQSSLQTTPSVSHNASCMLGERPRTVPNILSHRRKQAPPTTPPETTAESLALVPAEVLSLVGAALPGQPVLSLNPLMALQTLPPSDLLLQRHHHLVPEAPPPQVDSAGSDRIKDQNQVMVGGAPDSECLTSLLNEIVFLNQQVVTTATTTGVPSPRRLSSEVGPQDEGHAHNPWLLQLDSDSDDTVTLETVEAGLNNGPQPANENTTSGVLAPPPLLQMKVGGAKVTDSATNHEATEEGVGGTAWRPMPRLVPLGLRGNPAS